MTIEHKITVTELSQFIRHPFFIKHYLCIGLVLLAFSAYAQEKIYVDKYVKEVKSVEDAAFYFTLSNKKSSRINSRTIYYLNGQKAAVMQFSDYPKLIAEGKYERWYETGEILSVYNFRNGVFDGKYEEWHQNGNMKVAKTFVDGTLVGKCETGFENGKICSSKFYVDGKLEGNYQEWYDNGKPRYEAVFIDGKFNGVQNTWFQSGELESTVNFIDGKEEGIFKLYYFNCQKKRIDNYVNGKLIDGKCFDDIGREIPYFIYKVQPSYPGGLEAFYEYVGQNFKSPNKGKGRIFVQFYVDKEGNVGDVSIVKGINMEMDNEAIRVVKHSKQWIPGTLDGFTARALYSLPIRIN